MEDSIYKRKGEKKSILNNQKQLSSILKNIISFSKLNSNLKEKYSEQYFLTYFDHKNITRIANSIQNHQIEMTLEEFVRIFACVIDHKEHQTLFLIMSLIIFFHRIKEETKNQYGVKFTDFTNYLCDKISDNDPDLVIPMRQIPNQKMLPDIDHIRQIDIDPPIIFNKVQQLLPKISKDKKKKDKKLEDKKPIGKFVFSPSLKMIITLGRLCSSISLYDTDLKMRQKIIPSQCKQMAKDVAILSFAYCDSAQRIGCIINNIGLTFWEASDNFTTQKIISKSYGQKIYYLPLFNQWITVDKNTIYFWDLKQEKVSKTLKRPDSMFINDICQIDHIRALCVSYTLQNDHKIIVLYQKQKQIAKLQLGSAGCHTLHFNKYTQVFIPLGYKSTIPVYQIDSQTYDLNLVSKLKGHTSILSCITHVQNTSLIMTGDDVGIVRVWQLNYMRCLQVIRVSKWLGSLQCIGNHLIYSDSRLNIIPVDEFKQKAKDIQFPIYKFYRKQTNETFMITRKDIRIINMQNGRNKQIFIVCGDQQEISAAQMINNGIILGNSKGELFMFTFKGKKKWKISSKQAETHNNGAIIAHQNQVTHIRYDNKNRLFITSSLDSHIYIWGEKVAHQQGPKKALFHNSPNRHLTIVEISPQNNLLITGCEDQKSLFIWDYQSMKLCNIIKTNAPPTSVFLANQIPLLVIGTSNGNIYILKFHRTEFSIDFQLLDKISDEKSTIFISSIPLRREISLAQPRYEKIIQGYVQSEFIRRKNKHNTLNPCGNAQEDFSEKYYNFTNKLIQSHPCSYIQYVQSTQQVVEEETNEFLISNIYATISRESSQIYFSHKKGWVTCYDISKLVKKCFYSQQSQQNIDNFKRAADMNRPIRESFEKQFNKSQYKLINLSNQQIKFQGASKFIFETEIHKDNINNIEILHKKNKYLSTTCLDGYFKICKCPNAQIVCSSNINYPLPINWDQLIDNESQLRKQIHQALIVIDNIFLNQGDMMTKIDINKIDITNFLKDMVEFQKKEGEQEEQTQKKIILLKDEYTPEDIRGIPAKESSLKILEAYKRVKLMRNINKENDQKEVYIQPTDRAKQQDRQAIADLLSPNYFPQLLNKNFITEDNKIKDPLENHYESILEKAINKENLQAGSLKKKEKTYANKSQCLTKKTKSFFSSGKYQAIQNKPVNDILKSINEKLATYKQNMKSKKKL